MFFSFFIWDGSKKENKAIKWISKRRYNICFVDGFNDNQELINRYPQTKWNDGKARKILNNIYMLERGEIFNIEGNSFFAFGGGESLECESSPDMQENKLPSYSDMENGINNLDSIKNSVDYIISHEAPSKIKLFINMENNEVDHLNTYLDSIRENTKFKQWYIGKYHSNKIISPCYHLLFTDVVKINPK
ncbi:MAG: hypothetical protein RSA79_01145 [Oscillospiraceae bacterium]